MDLDLTVNLFGLGTVNFVVGLQGRILITLICFWFFFDQIVSVFSFLSSVGRHEKVTFSCSVLGAGGAFPRPLPFAVALMSIGAAAAAAAAAADCLAPGICTSGPTSGAGSDPGSARGRSAVPP